MRDLVTGIGGEAGDIFHRSLVINKNFQRSTVFFQRLLGHDDRLRAGITPCIDRIH